MKLLKFEKENCNPCTMVQNYLEDAGVEFEKIDAFEEPDKAAEYEISSVPTVILVDDEGKEIKRTIGFNLPELEELVEAVKE